MRVALVLKAVKWLGVGLLLAVFAVLSAPDADAPSPWHLIFLFALFGGWLAWIPFYLPHAEGPHQIPRADYVAHTTRARARKALAWCATVVIVLGSGCGGASGSGAVQDGAADRSTADSSATNAPLDEENLRQNVLAALRGVEAWQVEVVGEGGYRTTEWWSCNSSMYRWDDASGGVTISNATDGSVLVTIASDGVASSQSVAGDSARAPNPTVFTTYSAYLVDARPLTLDDSAGDSYALRLNDAPSILTAIVDSATHLPVAFRSSSEFTGSSAVYEVEMRPISLDELSRAVEDVMMKAGSERLSDTGS